MRPRAGNKNILSRFTDGGSNAELVGGRSFQKLQATFPSFYNSAYEQEVESDNNGSKLRRDMKARERASE